MVLVLVWVLVTVLVLVQVMTAVYSRLRELREVVVVLVEPGSLCGVVGVTQALEHLLSVAYPLVWKLQVTGVAWEWVSSDIPLKRALVHHGV